MDTTSQRTPQKYAKLKQAEAAGLAIPKSLLLEFLGGNVQVSRSMASFLEALSSSRFIVRSAEMSEDGDNLSLAGHFWSSGPITAKQVNETILIAKRENAAMFDSLQLAKQVTTDKHQADSSISLKLILQEYIEHEVGGVLFSPWSFFPDYAYVEYSEAGVNKVVEGGSSHSALLCLDAHFPDSLPLAEAQAYLKQALVTLCHKLSKIYDFPVDCEWAYDEEKRQVIVLQVRPQTHRIGPVLPFSKLKLQTLSDDHSAKSPFDVSENWQFTALSESLGRLSPLSFSLLQQLYIDTIPRFRALGCKSQTVDFMVLAPDGTVLVDPLLEKSFYDLTLFGGFKRGAQQSKLILEAHSSLQQYDSSAAFAYATLQHLFECWMTANLLGGGKGRGVSKTVIVTEPTHAYELSWPAVIEEPIVLEDVKGQIDLEVLNISGRALFLFELNKLKHHLSQQFYSETQQLNPNYLYFSQWQVLEKEGIAAANINLAKTRQHELAPLAFYDYALFGSENKSEVQILSSIKVVEGPLLLIENPASFQEPLMPKCILVAPYFDNQWVNKIKCLKGIVVKNGSRLSHSAIVAREYGVPYYVVPELNLETLDQGQCVVLDPKTVSRL